LILAILLDLGFRLSRKRCSFGH